MKLFVLVLAVVSLTVRSVHAESRTPAEATAHAYGELLNAIAQGKVTLTPTPSPTATPTSLPTDTPTPVPTDTPVPTPAATPTVEPCWLTDEDGIVFDEDGAPVPCLNDLVGADQIEETFVATIEPTSAPRKSAQPVAAPAAARPVAPAPTYTALPTYTPLATYTPQATPTAIATATSTAAATSTPTATVTAVAAPAAVQVATAAPTTTPKASTALSTGHWDWFAFFKAVAIVAVLVAVLGWLISRRRTAVWHAPKGVPHA